jgi:hypothetical protein
MVSTQEPRSSEQIFRLDGEMMEMLLLLPNRQAAALERAARAQGLTSAQLTRRLIAAYLDKAQPHLPRPGGKEDVSSPF